MPQGRNIVANPKIKGEKYEPNELYKNLLAVEFENYLKTQGFPELVFQTDKEFIYKYLKEGIMEKIIYQDLPKVFEIREVETLKRLVFLIFEKPGQLLDFQTLASGIGTSRTTVSNYLSYLQDAFLVKKLYNYSANFSICQEIPETQGPK